MNNVTLFGKLSRDKKKTWYYLDYGSRSMGGRKATGIYLYHKPKTPIERSHNKEAEAILETKRSQASLEQLSTGTGYIPAHKFKANFIEYYEEFVKNNERPGNRSLSCSLSAFKKFIKRDTIPPSDITENLCERFRQYLLDTLTGETPADYFMRFKRMIKAASKEGYFKTNPAEDIKVKGHPSGVKEVLTREEYATLLKLPCSNHEVKRAAVTSMYSGLRWADVSVLEWNQIKEETIALKRQTKTGVPLEIPLHPVVKAILGDRRGAKALVFSLPTQDGANKVLKNWVKACKIEKHITWHCLRHSVSDILIDVGVDIETVASFLGHKTAKHVLQTYRKRVKAKDIKAASNKLPNI